MNETHTKRLWEVAPVLYSGRHLPITENLMPFGFECNDGWYRPIFNLSVKLEVLNVQLEAFNVMIQALQVKEKFGTLHFYYSVQPINDEGFYDDKELTPEEKEKVHKQEIMMEYAHIMADEYIQKAENECMEVCEDCGTYFYHGNPRVMTTGWISIVCKDCAEKTNRSYKLYPDLNKDPFSEDDKGCYRKSENQEQNNK